LHTLKDSENKDSGLTGMDDLRNTSDDLIKALEIAGDQEVTDAVRKLIRAKEDIGERIFEEIHVLRGVIEEEVKRLSVGFPNNNPDGHSQYHLALIKSHEKREQLKDAIIEKGLVALSLYFSYEIIKVLWVHAKKIISD